MEKIINSMSILIEKRGGYIISSIECDNIAEVLNLAGIATYSRCIPLENDSLDYYEFIAKGHEFSIMPLQERPSHTRLQYLTSGSINTSSIMR